MTITTEEAERIVEEATHAFSAASTSRPRYSPGAGGQTMEATARATIRQISDWHLELLFEAVHALRTLAPERDAAIARAERAEAEAERLREALHKIANGDGVYGMQAGEYKAIARAALEGGDDADRTNEKAPDRKAETQACHDEQVEKLDLVREALRGVTSFG